MEAMHKTLLLVTAMICATVLAAALILASGESDTVLVPAGDTSGTFCPPRLEALDAC